LIAGSVAAALLNLRDRIAPRRLIAGAAIAASIKGRAARRAHAGEGAGAPR
jgi:hypothetical protein